MSPTTPGSEDTEDYAWESTDAAITNSGAITESNNRHPNLDEGFLYMYEADNAEPGNRRGVGQDSSTLQSDTGAGRAAPQSHREETPLEDATITLPPPSNPLNRFEAYVKDTFGAHVPSFREQTGAGPMPSNTFEASSQRNFWDISGYSSGGNGPSGGKRAVVNMALRSTLALEHQVKQLDSADMEYLRSKGAFDLPSRKLQEDLVEAFFADVHPTAPVINRSDFLTLFKSGGGPSRLLLFAIFTTASRACRNPALLDNTGTNQGSAVRFYKATKV